MKWDGVIGLHRNNREKDGPNMEGNLQLSVSLVSCVIHHKPLFLTKRFPNLFSIYFSFFIFHFSHRRLHYIEA